MVRPRFLRNTLLSLAAALLVPISTSAARAQNQCRFLLPKAAGEQPWVQKRISADHLLARANWNTDFNVDRGYRFYRITIRSLSPARGLFPIAVFLRFADRSSLQMANENLPLNPEEQHRLGPFPDIAGKRTVKVNVRLGSASMPASTGLRYEIAVEGCD